MSKPMLSHSQDCTEGIKLNLLGESEEIKPLKRPTDVSLEEASKLYTGQDLKPNIVDPEEIDNVPVPPVPVRFGKKRS